MNHVAFQAIKESTFFEGLDERSYARLAETAKRVEIAKREPLFLEGQQGDAVFLLAQGCVQLSNTTPDGNEIVIRTIREGEVFAEVVLFEQSAYPVSATATTPTIVFSFAKADILGLLDQADFRNGFIASLMRKQRYLADRVRYLTSFDVEQRLLLFLRDHYGASDRVTVDLSKRDLAAAIGATPETLSRLLKRSAEAGLLKWTDKVITVSPEAWQICEIC